MFTNVWRRSAAAALLAVAVSGCAYRYAPIPDFDFEGISAEGTRARIVRIFVIHGMGDHFPGYSDSLVKVLASRTGLVGSGSVEERTIKYMGGNVEAARLRIARLRPPASDPEFRVYELTWSPLTMPIKDKHLNYDREPAYPFGRAILNKALKEELIDRAFSDAILYVGDFGRAMRWTVGQGICHMLNDNHSGEGICDMANTDVPGLEADQLVLVSSSLGSRMMLDSMLEMLGDAKSQPAVETALAKTNLVFMLANQVPLLGLANVQRPEGGTGSGAQALVATPAQEVGLAGFIKNWSFVQNERAKIRQLPQDAVRRPLRLVAFSDPNDLLSFRLTREAAAGRNDVEIVNVVVSNVPEILGVFARPDTAHTSYGENSGVIDLMVCGSKNLVSACAP